MTKSARPTYPPRTLKPSWYGLAKISVEPHFVCKTSFVLIPKPGGAPDVAALHVCHALFISELYRQEMRREPTTHSLAILLKWNSRVPQPVLCRNLCRGRDGRVHPCSVTSYAMLTSHRLGAVTTSQGLCLCCAMRYTPRFLKSQRLQQAPRRSEAPEEGFSCAAFYPRTEATRCRAQVCTKRPFRDTASQRNFRKSVCRTQASCAFHMHFL